MRLLRLSKLINVIIVVAIIISTALVSYAQTQERDAIDEIRFMESVDLSIYDSNPTERVIQCFDVNEKGWFAVGYRTKEISVYDDTGSFQYGCRFSCNGDYGITLLPEGLAIYFVRGDIVAEFDQFGELVSVEKTMFSNETLNKLIYKTSERIGNTTYSLERDIGIFRGDYSRLVSVDESGVRQVIYDVTNKGYISGILHFAILLAIPALIVVSIISAVKKELYDNCEGGQGNGFE